MMGLDLVYNIHDYIFKHLSGQKEPSPLLKKLRGEGKLGFKTGEGFQTWTDSEKAASKAALNGYLVNMLSHTFTKPVK